MGVLGGSWAVLEGSWRVLGPSWAVLGRHGSLRVMLEPTRSLGRVALEGPREAKMKPKWDPRRTEIEDKNEVEKRRS